ncbi:MAG: UDP-4-amino-4,6-dideoxy-N-acetyl-beta-L-altrosamine transaminase [Candidatus Omnitrophota bacterium]
MRFIPYGHHTIGRDDIRAVVDVLNSDWITQGSKIGEFEDAVCKYTGAKYAVAVNSGTAALHAASFAAGIKCKDEVITSPVTFLATANCIVYQKAKPVFADINANSLNINPEEIERKITRRTKAIIAVHFAGFPCNMDKILSIAKKNRLIVIEDASHALGAQYKGRKIGSIGNMTTFSFHPLKSITTGEGGMILTNNKKLYTRLLCFRNHGIVKNKKKLRKIGPWYYEMQNLGYNYRITDFQCALGINQLAKLDKFIRRREEIAIRYNELFKDIDNFIEFPQEVPNYIKHAWHLYIIQLRLDRLKISRKKFFNILRNKNIGVQVHYIPIHLQPFYKRNFGYKKGDFPQAERFYERAITLPIFPALANKDIDRIAKTVKSLVKNR